MRQFKFCYCGRVGIVITLISLVTACTSTPEQSSTAVQPVSSAPQTESPTPSNSPIAISGSTDPTRAIEQPVSTPSPSTPPIASSSSSPPAASTSTVGVSSQTDGFSSGGSSISGDFSLVDRALQDLGAKTVGNEIQIDLPADVLFDFDKANVRPNAATALNKLLTIVKAQTGNGRIRIEGHTDAIADAAYNRTLSERRANSVKTWLIDRGIATSRLTTKGLGESRPIAANTKPDGSDNPSGRQKNRRVQVTIEK